MTRLVWGKNDQLKFVDEHEYYNALGSLCNEESYSITYEKNSQTESWTNAYRIRCREDDCKVPDAFLKALKDSRRINCNDYVENLIHKHNFDFYEDEKIIIGNYESVKKTVPPEYIHDFEEGYHFVFHK